MGPLEESLVDYERAREQARREREDLLAYMRGHADLIAQDISRDLPPGLKVTFEIEDVD